MSLEQLKTFLETAAANETLRNELDELLRNKNFSRIVEIGAEAGFTFGEEDCAGLLEAVRARGEGQPAELADQDLEAVVGGARLDPNGNLVTADGDAPAVDMNIVLSTF